MGTSEQATEQAGQVGRGGQPLSAVLVRIRLPRRLARMRARWDPMASAGVPAHVTILVPFVADPHLDSTIRAELADIAGRVRPFDVTFAAIGRFPTTVYLAPEPAAPFIRMTEAVVARYPDHPPYGGAFDAIVPHLTISDTVDAPADEIAEEAARSLPFTRRVTALEVMAEGRAGAWRVRWRIPLGVRR